MKILISCDMEGISGVVDWDHVDPGHPEYQRFRRIMTYDINAAVRGAFDGGATEVIVTDGHENKRNIIYEELDQRALLNCGAGLPLAIVQGAETGVNGALFIGFHARYGAPEALLCHTWSGVVRNLWLNEVLVGETGLCAALCGHFNVPVIMVSGDDKVCAEATELLGELEKAVVKHSLSRLSAVCLPLEAAHGVIYDAAVSAVTRLTKGNIPAAYRLSTPIKMLVEVMEPEMMAPLEKVPGTKRLEGTRIAYTAKDMLEAFRVFREYNHLAADL